MTESSANTATFHFKRFSVSWDGGAMGVGTDGVLLGAWAGIPRGAQRLLDVGTGSGLIALMLAQRAPEAEVTAIDISAAAAATARANAAGSPFATRISVEQADVRSYDAAGPFGLIACNPPYFPAAPQPSGTARSMARSFETLSPGELVAAAARLLAPGGSLAVVVPAALAEEIAMLAWEHDLLLSRRTDVATVEGKSPKRTLLQFTLTSRAGIPLSRDTLTLMRPDGRRTEQYAALTRDFYLAKT